MSHSLLHGNTSRSVLWLEYRALEAYPEHAEDLLQVLNRYQVEVDVLASGDKLPQVEAVQDLLSEGDYLVPRVPTTPFPIISALELHGLAIPCDNSAAW